MDFAQSGSDRLIQLETVHFSSASRQPESPSFAEPKKPTGPTLASCAPLLARPVLCIHRERTLARRATHRVAEESKNSVANFHIPPLPVHSRLFSPPVRTLNLAICRTNCLRRKSLAYPVKKTNPGSCARERVARAYEFTWPGPCRLLTSWQQHLKDPRSGSRCRGDIHVWAEVVEQKRTPSRVQNQGCTLVVLVYLSPFFASRSL